MILRAQKPDGSFGEVQMDSDGRILVADGLFRPQDILNFPSVGTPRTAILEGADPEPGAMLYHGAGVDGVVRNIWLIAVIAGPNWSDIAADAELRIWTGLGDVADRTAAPAEEPTCRINLKTLLGAHYDATGPTAPRGNGILDMRKTPKGPVSALIMQLTTPIPFRNGVLIQLFAEHPDVTPAALILPSYQVIEYELGSLADFPYADWRLRAASHSAVVPHGDTATFLNVPADKGMLVGTFVSVDGQADNLFLENNWAFRPDGSATDIWQTSGSEDLFGMEAYYFEAGAFCADQWGCYYKDAAQFQYEAYRLFTKAPIIWRNGMVGRWVRTDDNTHDVQLDVTTLYYAP